MDKFKNVPSEMIGPVLLAWYKAIHYQIPDPGPIEISTEEATKLAREVIRAVTAYLPQHEREQAVAGGIAAHPSLSVGHEFREATNLEVYSHSVDGAPGCCVGIGGRIVCVKLAV